MRRSNSARLFGPGHLSDQAAFTLVEMLIAVAITLVMMAAVVTLFANITESVRARRATMEMSSQLRHVSSMLQKDLIGHTCPGTTWQDPSSNMGYIELIEGQYRDTFPSMLTDNDPDSDRNNNVDLDGDGIPGVEDINPALTSIPLNNAGTLANVNGLGDYDDILMFTSRNEHEPFVGRVPDYNTNSKGFTTLESPLAEVIWFAIENPQQEERAKGFFGEPGFRTIYRRALLIAPWVDPYGDVLPKNPVNSHPGVVELLNPNQFGRGDLDKALAALISCQDQYDISVRLEWDALALNGTGQWKIVANTLADLTKRENRYLHYQYQPGSPSVRKYPYAITSAGTYATSNADVAIVSDPRFPPSGSTGQKPKANLLGTSGQYHVASYTVTSTCYDPSTGRRYQERPFAYVDVNPTTSSVPATANVVLNDEGQVVRVVQGPVPLWGKRRGEDVMMTEALAFDMRVYDPGAPLYQETSASIVLEPSDPGWRTYYHPTIGNVSGPANGATFVGQGAYVDMGYSFNPANPPGPPTVLNGAPWILPWFAAARGLFDVPTGNQLAPGYAVYDTWSTSYENNGIDDDANGVIDQGTNGLDDLARYSSVFAPQQIPQLEYRYGPDDIGERETAPPYDKPLRGVQVIMRVYERDSRQIRQVRVDQHLLAE